MFKIGDTVRRIGPRHLNMRVGDLGTVMDISPVTYSVRIYEYGFNLPYCWHGIQNLELVTSLNKFLFKLVDKYD